MTITLRSVPQGAAIKFRSVEQGIRLRPSTIPTLKLRATSKLPGPANVLSIGTVTDGVTADATITGSSPSQVLNLVLPKGDKGDTGSTGPQGTKGDDGDQGPTGATGPANSLSIGTVEDGPTADATITGTAPTQTLNLVLPKGDQGDSGDAATIAVGTVTTVDPTDPATVTNVGTSAAAVFNFEIPKGADGAGAVDSVFGRSGVVTAATSDYDASQIDNDSSVVGSTVKDALETLAASGGAVDSVNGQTGVVVLDAGDIGTTPAGNLSSTDVQAALSELDSEKQPLDSDLTAIAGLSPSNDDVVQRKAGAWTNRSMAQLASDLGLAASYQPLDSDLTAIAGLSPTNDDIVQRKAGAWANRTMAQLATDLGLAANYQPLDSDLTSWAAVTRASGYDTFAATPSSANLRSLLTDESGTGAAIFADSPTFTTQITAPKAIGGAGAGSSLTLQSTSGTGTSDYISFKTGSQIEAMQITTLQRIIIGLPGEMTNGNLQYCTVQDAGKNSQGFVGGSHALMDFSNTDQSSFLGFFKTRNTTKGNNHTVVQNGDGIGEINFNADDGTNYINAAYFGTLIDTAPSTGITPVKFYWGTMNSGGTLADRMYLSSAGNLSLVSGTVTAGAFIANSSTSIADGMNRASSGVIDIWAGSGRATRFFGASSNVNYISFAGADTGVGVVIAAQGSDTDVNMFFISRGAGSIFFQTGGNSFLPQFAAAHVASSVNYLQAKGGVTGTPGVVELSAQGSDSNIDLMLSAKGTGRLKIGTSGMFTANGSVATAMSSLGPTGSHTTIQKWLTVKDSGGTLLYIPCF